MFSGPVTFQPFLLSLFRLGKSFLALTYEVVKTCAHCLQVFNEPVWPSGKALGW